MAKKAQPFIKWTGLLGIVMPAVMIGFILAAISQAPWWSLTDNSISRLAGGPDDRPFYSATGAPAILLNTGLLLCGVLGTAFGIGLWRSDMFSGGWGKAGKAFYIASVACLYLVGVFPLTFGEIHTAVSYTLFILAPASMVMMGVEAMLTGGRQKNLGRLLLFLAILGAFPFFVIWPWPGLAISEFIAIVPQSVFAIVVGIRLFKGNPSTVGHV